MNVVLDVSCINNKYSGAKERFVSLYKNFISQNKDKNFLIIYSEFDGIKKIFNFSNVKFLRNFNPHKGLVSKIFSSLTSCLILLPYLKSIKIVENFTIPFFRLPGIIYITTVHDLRRCIKKTISSFFYRPIFRYFFYKSNIIITVSKTIEKELINFTKKQKIKVIYNSIKKENFREIKKKKLDFIKKKFLVSGKFILSVGHIEERKNYNVLVKSIYYLKKKNQNIKLIIVGQKSDAYSDIIQLINKLDLNNNISIFSDVKNYELRYLYMLTELLVFPSKYEGFGIPILEALACNKPLVLSNIKVFKEITEGKFIYFKVTSPKDLSGKIYKVLNNKKIKKEMATHGKKILEKYTVEKNTKLLNKIYNNIYNNN